MSRDVSERPGEPSGAVPAGVALVLVAVAGLAAAVSVPVSAVVGGVVAAAELFLFWLAFVVAVVVTVAAACVLQFALLCACGPLRAAATGGARGLARAVRRARAVAGSNGGGGVDRAPARRLAHTPLGTVARVRHRRVVACERCGAAGVEGTRTATIYGIGGRPVAEETTDVCDECREGEAGGGGTDGGAGGSSRARAAVGGD